MREEEQQAVQDDRREYFRVDDAVRLSITPVPEDQLSSVYQRLEQNIANGFTVMSSLAAISAEMAVSMRRIENSDPDVAAYLKALDRKIEVLGRAFIAQESELIAGSACPVNLSAGGMGMLTNECYHPGQVLEIKMLLFPSFTGILMYGSVVDCIPLEAEQDPDYRYKLRVAFTHMREQDRDLLIRHVLRRQSKELRKKESVQQENGGDAT